MLPAIGRIILTGRNRRRHRIVLAIACLVVVATATISHAFFSVNSSYVSFSQHSDRSQARGLGTQTVSGRIYIFLSYRDPNIKYVTYFINPGNNLRNKDAYSSSRTAPYDLAGTTQDGTPLPFDTQTLALGQNTLVTRVTFKNGYVHHDVTFFNVQSNSAGQPVTTTRPTTTVPPTTSVTTTTRPEPTVPNNPSQGGRVVAYYASWSYWDGLTPSQIPASKLTDINYSFANVVNGRCVSDDPAHDARVASELVALRNRNPHLQLTLAVGGASWSSGFSYASSLDQRRSFVQSCLDLASSLGFDGIDIDWEYPAAHERSQWGELLATFRTQMNSHRSPTGKAWTLTSAIPVGWYLQNDSRFDVARAHQYVDFFNLMAYDIRGGWSSTTGHHSSLQSSPGDPTPFGSVESLIYLERQGVPRNKMVLGVPFYGYVFSGVSADNNGLFQAHSGAQQIPYKDLVNGQLVPATKFRDTSASVPWAYNTATRTMISYDDPASIRTKANYVLSGGYGGIMAWELGQDASGWPLLSAMGAPFGR